MCFICLQAANINAFTKGCFDFRKAALRVHAAAKDHLRAEKAAVGQKEMRIARMNAITMADDVMLNLFRVAYSVAKRKLSMTQFVHEVQTLKLFQVKVITLEC